MQADPVGEWQRLTDEYRRMNDDELRDLALDFADLTDPAQQALRGELHSRGLGDPESVDRAPQLRSQKHDGDAADDVPATDDDGAPHEYTWKTLLCECDTHAQAWQLTEALK